MNDQVFQAALERERLAYEFGNAKAVKAEQDFIDSLIDNEERALRKLCRGK